MSESAYCDASVPAESTRTDMPQPLSIRKAKSVYASVVTFYVGSERHPLVIHKELLCLHSPYCRAALEGNFAEGTQDFLEFRDEELETLEAYQVILYQLGMDIHQDLNLDWEEYEDESHKANWLLLPIKSLRLRRYDWLARDLQRALAGWNPMRRLLVDVATASEPTGWMRDTKEYPPEFLAAALLALHTNITEVIVATMRRGNPVRPSEMGYIRDQLRLMDITRYEQDKGATDSEDGSAEIKDETRPNLVVSTKSGDVQVLCHKKDRYF
ncbi:MAG: hypothetical protein MMC23_005465 [Stictis urceolatum]|nr:hypothetical protein [Stictis urceolata]